MEVFKVFSSSILFFCLLLSGISIVQASDQLANKAAEQLPVEYFSQLPKVSSLKLSPQGDKLLGAFNVGENTFIAVRNVLGGKLIPLIKTDNNTFKMAWFEWLNNDYIALSVWFPAVIQGTPVTKTRLLVKAANGTGDLFPLVAPNERRSEIDAQYQDNVVSWLRDDPDHILMALNYENWSGKTVYKVNVSSGKKSKRKRVQRFKLNATRWVVDQQDRPRAYVAFEDTTYKVYAADEQGKSWRMLWQYDIFTEDEVLPLYFAADPNILYVSAIHNGYDAVFSVDINDPELKKTLIFAEDGFDASGDLVISPKTKRLIGIVSSEKQSAYNIWDKSYQPFFSAIGQALPDRTNYLVGFSRDENQYLLYSESSNAAGEYYFGDRQTKKLSLMASQYPTLSNIALPEKRYIKYEARDGLTISGYLTLPLTTASNSDQPSAALPTIVFPHGGPIHHETSDFDYWTQFFASRGYAVLQMNFRGSSGYGFDFMTAGLKNWGLTMQDDIVDGVEWLVDEGISDKDRICIVGASYGGYAALMGLAKTPDLFRCGISFAGVTDLKKLRRHQSKFMSAKVFDKQIGKDIKQLKATSPTTWAADITAPLLLIQGDKDRSVPLTQARAMVKVLKKNAIAHEYIEIEQGDHFLTKQQHRTRVFKAMDEFLAKHLPVN